MAKTQKVFRTYISQFEHEGQTIDLMYSKGQISYVFEVKGKRYGNAVKCEGKSIRDIMNATSALLMNYWDTKKAILND